MGLTKKYNLSFRSRSKSGRGISNVRILRFLVASLLEMTSNDFFRDNPMSVESRQGVGK